MPEIPSVIAISQLGNKIDEFIKESVPLGLVPGSVIL
jgi:hypothetical protein